MKMDTRRILFTSLAILFVMASCIGAIRAQTVQDLVRDAIVLPVVYAAWLAGLLLRSVAQPLLWTAGLIILGLLLLYGVYLAWPARLPPLQLPGLDEGRPPDASGQVRYWRNKIESLRSQGFDSDYASFEFRLLTKAIVAGAKKNGSPPHPPEIDGFFSQASEPSEEIASSTHSWRETLQKRLAFKRRQPQPEHDPLEELCTFLEEQLEIDHDDSD